MLINYDLNLSNIIGKTLPRPEGELSGHAAGAPFEKMVADSLKRTYPTNIFKQYEFLNSLYASNPDATTYNQRLALIQSQTVSMLTRRGRHATQCWSATNLFKEKQNDTADVLYVRNNTYDLIDVKTRNLDINSQPQNIISAFKLAQAVKLMLDTSDYDSFDLVYIEVGWRERGNVLECESVHIASIFKEKPESLYINFSAAIQIQFHVCDLTQDFTGTKEEWARRFLTHFYYSVLQRSEQLKQTFAHPFQSYILPRN